MDGVGGMGAKYLPTHKDRKASQRFQRNQATVLRPKTKAVTPPAKGKKK